MKFPLLNIDGTKSNSIELSDKFVKLKVNHKLIKFVIDWQFNHAKPRTAKTKQRNEIRGSTKKISPQKGGGGARHASKKAPLFVGGGVAHGPKGSNYKIKKTKEMNAIVKKFEITHSLIILDKSSKEKVEKSMRNIPNIKVTDINHFSAFDIIKFKKVVLTESSVKELEKRYS